MNERLSHEAAEHIYDLLESSPEFRRHFDELLLRSQTDLPPNGEGFECLKFLRDSIKGMNVREKYKASQ